MRLEKALVGALRRHLAQDVTPQLPEGTQPLWRAFCELDNARTHGPHGPQPIQYSEIVAWCQLTRTPLAPHHVRIVKAMDAALIEHFHHRDGQDRRPVGNLSPELFDAVMG